MAASPWGYRFGKVVDSVIVVAALVCPELGLAAAIVACRSLVEIDFGRSSCCASESVAVGDPSGLLAGSEIVHSQSALQR